MDAIDKIIIEFFPEKIISPWQKRMAGWLLGIDKLSPLMHETSGIKGVEWVEAVIDSLNIRCETHCGDYDNLPEEGAAVIIANHPTVMDGLAIINTLSRVRKDIQIVANHVLTVMFPQIKDITIGIRNMQGKVGHRQIKEMNDHLKSGGVLIIFPAGRLASITPFGLKEARWQEGFLRLAIRHDAALVPVHISGANSIIYYLAAIIWRPLSNLMIFRECLRHRGNILRLKITSNIDLREYNLTDNLNELSIKCRRHLQLIGRGKSGILSVVPALARAEQKKELAMAINECGILQNFSDGKKLLLYRFQEGTSATLLNELGRLREMSFREIGAGTGKKRDNDKYDFEYAHIILWDSSCDEIAGAYRLMPAAEQIEKRGLEGLYSYSLFKYKPEFIPQLKKSIEIGRGFIQKRYQKTKALDSLWKGIFNFIKEYPEYENFLGVLTIPRSASPYIQQLIIYFYQLYFSAGESVFDCSWGVVANNALCSDVFCGNDFYNDWIKLNEKIREAGSELPWPYKQAAKWYNPGGSVLFGFVEDEKFNSIAGLNFCKINSLKKCYYSHYLSQPAEEASAVQSLQKKVAAN